VLIRDALRLIFISPRDCCAVEISSWVFNESETISFRRGAGDGVGGAEVFIGDCAFKFLILIYFTSLVNSGSGV
jgi:hypothetical protein